MHLTRYLAVRLSALLVAIPPSVASATEVTPSVFAQATPPSTRITPPAGPSLGNAGNPSGISTDPKDNTAGAQTIPAPSQPISNTPTSGLFPALGGKLLGYGIDFHGVAFDHFVANPTAGVVTGQRVNLGIFAPAVDLDLGKLAGVTGGNLHIAVTAFGLKSNTPNGIGLLGGYLVGHQATPAVSGAPLVLSQFTYEQKLLDDKLSIEFGKTNAFHYFLLPNGLDPFTYDSPNISVVGDVPPFPFPVWGGRVNYHLTPNLYVQAGAFEDNWYRATNSPFAFGISRNSGVQSLAEIGYRSEFANAALPASFELGIEANPATGYLNSKGSPFPASPRFTAANYPRGEVLFFQGQKVIWAGTRDRNGPPANIAVYGSATASVSKPQPFDVDVLAGMTFTGLIPGRPRDAIGVQAHYQRLSAVEANFESRLDNIFARGGPSQPRDGFGFEVTGSIQLAPALVLRPSVQYYVSPDSYYRPFPSRRPSDGVAVSVLAIVPLGRLLGTSNKPF